MQSLYLQKYLCNNIWYLYIFLAADCETRRNFLPYSKIHCTNMIAMVSCCFYACGKCIALQAAEHHSMDVNIALKQQVGTKKKAAPPPPNPFTGVVEKRRAPAPPNPFGTDDDDVDGDDDDNNAGQKSYLIIGDEVCALMVHNGITCYFSLIIPGFGCVFLISLCNALYSLCFRV